MRQKLYGAQCALSTVRYLVKLLLHVSNNIEKNIPDKIYNLSIKCQLSVTEITTFVVFTAQL